MVTMTPIVFEGALSIVTVCMNRPEHLRFSSRRVAKWSRHQEHLIVDWSSHASVLREDLPDDPRIRLLRVEGEEIWNLARAYNFALSQACGSRLFKLDADCWPESCIDQEIGFSRVPLCHFGSGPDGRVGQWLMEREFLEAVGGFNELLLGYGFDDKDLKARLRLHLAHDVRSIREASIGVLPHSVTLRASQGGGSLPPPLLHSWSIATKRTSSLANRVIAASCPWSAHVSRSRYEQLPVAEGSAWCLCLGTAPCLPDDVRREIHRLRRETLWAEFLWLPQVLIRELPERLFPALSTTAPQVSPWHVLLWGLTHFTLGPMLLLGRRGRGACHRLRSLFEAPRRWFLQVLADGSRRCLGSPFEPYLPARLHRLALESRVQYVVVTEGLVSDICRDLLVLQQTHNSTAAIHQLLFRRGSRPRRPAAQVELFRWMAAELSLPDSIRSYALISLAYRSLKDDDLALSASLIPGLERQVNELEVDPGLRSCPWPNRRNRMKLLVSSLAVLLHLHLLQAQPLQCVHTADRLLRVMDGLDWALLPADVAYRLLTNAARLVGLAALMAWSSADDDKFQLACCALDRLVEESVGQRHNSSHAQEDHRGFVAAVALDLERLSPGAWDQAVALGERLLNVRTPLLQKRLRQLLQ